MPSPDPPLRIGALAKAAGLTVRTLRHYDATGLLCPGARTEAGHRLYEPADLARLQQIVSLKALGLPLSAISGWLDDPRADPLAVLDQHRAFLRREIEQQRRLAHHLDTLADALRTYAPVAPDQLLTIIQLTTMTTDHYAPDQLDRLRQRREALGADAIQSVQQQWADLFAAFDRHREAGTDPASADVQALTGQAETLIGHFTGGDASIRESLDQSVQAEPAHTHPAWGIGGALADYYGRAMEIAAARRDAS